MAQADKSSRILPGHAALQTHHGMLLEAHMRMMSGTSDVCRVRLHCDHYCRAKAEAWPSSSMAFWYNCERCQKLCRA